MPRRRASDPPLLPPGWYDDLDTGSRRYFDGERWTPTVMEMLEAGVGRGAQRVRWTWGSRLLVTALCVALAGVSVGAWAVLAARDDARPPVPATSESPMAPSPEPSRAGPGEGSAGG